MLDYFEDILSEYKKHGQRNHQLNKDILTEVICRENNIFVGYKPAKEFSYFGKTLLKEFGEIKMRKSTEILKESIKESIEKEAIQEVQKIEDENLKKTVWERKFEEIEDKTEKIFNSINSKDKYL